MALREELNAFNAFGSFPECYKRLPLRVLCERRTPVLTFFLDLAGIWL